MQKLAEEELEREIHNDWINHFNGKDAWLRNKYQNNPLKLTVFEMITNRGISRLSPMCNQLRKKGIFIQDVRIDREPAFAQTVLAVTIHFLDNEMKRHKVFRNIPNHI